MAGTRVAAGPPAARGADRPITPPVIVAGMVCATVIFTVIVSAGVYCLANGLDPEPLFKYLGPGALVAAAITLLNSSGLFAVVPKLARIERNTGAIYDYPPIPAQRTEFDDVVHGPVTSGGRS